MSAVPTEELIDTILRLAAIAEYGDADATYHLPRLSGVVRCVAEAMGLPPDEIDLLAIAATLHDVGKVIVPDEILLKPGPLTVAERETMQSHTIVGARLLGEGNTPLLQLASAIARSHHEAWDGLGYPDHLAGEQIPLPVRITTVAEVYDALVTRRTYRPAYSHADAVAIIRNGRGKSYDPAVVDAFFTVENRVRAMAQECNLEEDPDLMN